MKEYNKRVDQEIPDSLDSTKLYKNMSVIEWYSNYPRDRHAEAVSMVDLTSRITSLTTTILLLFQFVFHIFDWSYMFDDKA